MNTKLKTIILTALAFVLVSCGGAPVENGRGEPEPAQVESMVNENYDEDDAVQTETVAPQATEVPALTVLADGQIRNGKPALPLTFETSGKLLVVHVAAGDEVKAGDVIATLDDKTLQESVRSAELRLQSAKNSLLQAEGERERLRTWEPDASAVTIAEANITSAESNLANAKTQDAASGSSLTSVNIQIQQAQREVDSAQESYDNAFSPGREWEVQYNDEVCENRNGIEQCLGITYAERIKNDREFATSRLQNAKEQLQIAYSNYNIQAAQSSGNTAVGAESQLVAAREELARAQKGPTDAELAAAELNVSNATLTLEQEQFALAQAQDALVKAEIVAPWDGTVLSVDAAAGGLVGAGTPVVTLIDMSGLEFITTNLSERDLNQIEVGQAARITLKSYPNQPIDATVARIDLTANGTVGDAAIFPVILRFESPDFTVRQGMTGRVEILNGN